MKHEKYVPMFISSALGSLLGICKFNRSDPIIRKVLPIKKKRGRIIGFDLENVNRMFLKLYDKLLLVSWANLKLKWICLAAELVQQIS